MRKSSARSPGTGRPSPSSTAASTVTRSTPERNVGCRAVPTAVAAITVTLSWATVHTVFTLRYARLYYAAGGGIDFHEDRPPAYGDFAYLAFTIGMTYQVSDTTTASRTIRRTVLYHAYMSYIFGTVVVAMTINVVASLLNR